MVLVRKLNKPAVLNNIKHVCFAIKLLRLKKFKTKKRSVSYNSHILSPPTEFCHPYRLFANARFRSHMNSIMLSQVVLFRY